MDQIAPQVKSDENALAKRVLAHWQRELEGVPLIEEPFRHFYCDRMWPKDVYDEMLRLLPEREAYQPINLKVWVNAQGVSTRDRFPVWPETLEKVDIERANFWTQIWLALTADSFKRLIFSKFRKDIALRLGITADDVEHTQVFGACTLLRDFEDYKIKPHPDGWPGVVTLQFYLPPDMSQEDLGTSFYVELPWWRRPMAGRYKEIKRIPFQPNSGYAFAVNDLPGYRSLHGRELIRPGAGVRNTILMRWTAKGSSKKLGNEGFSRIHHLF